MILRYPKHYKGYIMFGEHPNGSMTEIDSRNVEFLDDEFPSINKIKKDLAFYELQQDDPISRGEEKNLNTHRVTKGRILPLFRRDDEISVI